MIEQELNPYPNDKRFAQIEFLKVMMKIGKKVLVVFRDAGDRYAILKRLLEEIDGSVKMEAGLSVGEKGRVEFVKWDPMINFYYGDFKGTDVLQFGHVLTHSSMFKFEVHNEYMSGLVELVDKNVSVGKPVLVVCGDFGQARRVCKAWFRNLPFRGFSILGDGLGWMRDSDAKTVVWFIGYPEKFFTHKNRQWDYVLTDGSVWRAKRNKRLRLKSADGTNFGNFFGVYR